jgi:hypothetical protein
MNTMVMEVPLAFLVAKFGGNAEDPLPEQAVPWSIGGRGQVLGRR